MLEYDSAKKCFLFCSCCVVNSSDKDEPVIENPSAKEEESSEAIEEQSHLSGYVFKYYKEPRETLESSASLDSVMKY